MYGLSFLPSGWVRTELQGTQEREDVVIGLVDTFGNIRRPCLIQGAFLDLHIRMQMDLRGFRAFVPEPKSNHGTTDPGAEQIHGQGVSQRVGTDPLVIERRAGMRCHFAVFPHDALDSVAAEATPAVGREHRFVRRSCPALAKPVRQCNDTVAVQRGRTFLAPLATTPEMRVLFGRELDITDIEGRQFRHTKAGLQCDEQQGPIPPPDPCGDIRRGKERGGFCRIKERDDALVMELGRNGEHLLTMQQQCRFAHGNEAEEGPDRSFTQIAGANTVPALLLDMRQEGADEVGIDIGDTHVHRRRNRWAGGRSRFPPAGGPHRRKGRTAKLTLRCTPVELLPPKERESEAPLRMIAVSALEETPPRRRLLPGKKKKKKKNEPLHWMLLSTEGRADLDTACTVLRWYELRWSIERFFHALKVGTRIEDRRLDEADDLRKCLAFDAITAFRVWDLSLLARERPDDPASRHVTEDDTSGHSVPSPRITVSRLPGDRRR